MAATSTRVCLGFLMKNYLRNKMTLSVFRQMLSWSFGICMVGIAVMGQAPPNPIPPRENIEAGALVIPMDNFHQGNAAQTTFNLRAWFS
jgi:hypothetical protein